MRSQGTVVPYVNMHQDPLYICENTKKINELHISSVKRKKNMLEYLINYGNPTDRMLSAVCGNQRKPRRNQEGHRDETIC